MVLTPGQDSAIVGFTAPEVAGGDPLASLELEFTLSVDDFTTDTIAPVADTVKVIITNVNNQPLAEAGRDQTVNENTIVILDGGASSDPDGDSLIYTWRQVEDGSPRAIALATSGSELSFTAPAVSAGGANLTFRLLVEDGYGGTANDTLIIHVQNVNDPPIASAAQPSVGVLWPPNHRLVPVAVTGVSDPNNDPVIITITGITQDEPTSGLGDGDTPTDAVINPDGTVLLRAERSGNGDGRVYWISFTAYDLQGGSDSGKVKVAVPRSRRTDTVVDGGPFFDSVGGAGQ